MSRMTGYFIKEIATGILDFQADKVQYYPCTYEEYLEQKQKEAQGLIGGNKTNAAGNSGKSRNVAGEAADNRNISQVGSQSNPPTLSDVFDKKTYYNPGKIISRLKQQLVKYEKCSVRVRNGSQSCKCSRWTRHSPRTMRN